MIPVTIWKFLHLFFGYGFVGMLIVSEWLGRAARASDGWGQRAMLFNLCRKSSAGATLALAMLGLMGNFLARPTSHAMNSSWMITANLLWAVAIVVGFAISRPAAENLFRIATRGERGESTDGYDAALSRWRLGNILSSVLYLALLVVMVFRW